MARPRFRITAHTADVRLLVWGDTEQELLAHAVAGAMRLALDRDVSGLPIAWRRVRGRVRDLASTLVATVNEALFLLYSRREVTVAVAWTEGHVSLGALGLAAGVEPEREVKAATFHALQPRVAGRRRSAVLVLDV
ncbi:MAG: archease [Acidobacteriota bacterium]